MNAANLGRATVSAASLALAAVVLLALGVGIGAILLPDRPPRSVAPAMVDRPFPVTTEVYDDARQVKVVPEVTADAQLWLLDSGRVTSSRCAPGALIESGLSPVTIDDRPVIALATSTPLWRDLQFGAKGADVRALQAELARLGLPIEVDGTFGRATANAVMGLFEDAGVARPSGVLPIASVLWLPAESVAVKECGVTLGSMTSDSPFATVPGALVSLRVADTVTDAISGDRVVRYGELVAQVDEGLVTEQRFLAAIQQGPEFAAWRRSDGSEALMLSYALAQAVDVSVVPPGAVYSLSGSRGCVVADGLPHSVTVLTSSLGQSLVTFDDGAKPMNVELTRRQERSPCQ